VEIEKLQMTRSCFNNAGEYDTAHLPGLVTSVVQGDTQTNSVYRGENRLYLVESTAPGQGSRFQAYTQNGLDQLTYEYHPETGNIDYLYNDEGNLETKTWSDATMTYTYNTANQLLSEADGAETISFVYDSNGRVQEINTSTNLWRRYDLTYNLLGAVTSEKQAVNGMGTDKTVAYRYDANGLLDELTYPDGKKAAYSNNGLLLPESLAFNNDSQRINAVTYGVNKQPLGYDLANGSFFTATYDAAGRIVTSGLGKGGTTLLAATYGYDDVGNIASLTNTTPAGNAGFSYDQFNRLTKATYPEKIFDYAYDPFGNMLTAEENSVKVFDKTYNGGNQVNGFGYDARGNLTTGDGLSQVWDKRNRMTESRIAMSGLLGTYTYNERGLRIKAERFGTQPTVQVVQPNGGENLYLNAMNTITWSSMGLSGTIKLELLVNGVVAGTIAENLPANRTSYLWQVGKTLTGTVNPGSDYKVRVTSVAPPSSVGMTYYFYDSGGRLLSEYDQAGVCVKDYLYLGGKMIGEFQPVGSKYYYYASDQINSTRLVTNATGAVVHSAQYDPYGGLYKTWVDTYHPKPGFSGKERESGSDYDYFGARYYGHRQYRFLSVDPLLEETEQNSLSINSNMSSSESINKNKALLNPQMFNLYSFNINNPITFYDPDGRSSLTFDRSAETLSLYKNNGDLVGTYNASNNATTGTSQWPNGTFTFSWHSPHPNAAESDAISASGNYIFNVPDRTGMGVHAGRVGVTDAAGRTGWQHATEGCIRTTEEGMTAINNRIQANDPLTQIIVQD
jgi:RHS repeat-associated protein